MPEAPGPQVTVGEARGEFVDWHDLDAERLRADQQAEIAVRYGGPGAEPEEQAAFHDAESVLATVLVRVGSRAVAVGSVRDLTGVPDGRGGVHPAGTGEVKRVYVEPGYRGRGLARDVMVLLEGRAAEEGLDRLVLESGTMQPEAMGLYLSLGYAPIESYGAYAGSVASRCFAKDLVPSRRGTVPAASRRPVQIRRTAWADADALALRRENFETSTAALYPAVREIGFEALDAEAGARVVVAFVAETGHGPVGTLALTRFAPGGVEQPGVGELRRLSVRPQARGRGIARALVATAERAAVGAGMSRLILETGIRQHAAVRLYTSLGYRPTRPYPPYEDSSVALCFAKELGGASALAAR